MTKNKSKPQRGIAVKRAEEKEAQLNWCWTNSSVDDSKRESKNAIKHLQAILESHDLASSDAEVFRLAISKLEGVAATLAVVKEALGKTELSKKPVEPLAVMPWDPPPPQAA